MTWKRAILLAGAALLLWLRPWRQLRALLSASPAAGGPPAGAAQSPYPEVLPVASMSPAAGDQPAAEARQEAISTPPEDAFGIVASDELPAEAELEAALSLDANLDLDDDDAAPAFGTDPAPAVPLEPDPVLEPDLIAMGEPEPVEMAEDELMDLPEPEPVAVAEPEPVEMAEDEPVAVAEPEPAAVDADERSQAVGAPGGRADDLLIIEGIGPMVSTVVSAAGITSFAALADADVEGLRATLAKAGIKNLDPATWPEQARMAADGRWDELRELQRRIKNGKKS